jgi:hypothetical protein
MKNRKKAHGDLGAGMKEFLELVRKIIEEEGNLSTERS